MPRRRKPAEPPLVHGPCRPEDLPAAQVRSPTMPIDGFIGEVQTTLAGARLHAARFAAIGFSDRWIRQAEDGLATLIDAQSRWATMRRRRRDTALSAVLARAQALRRELLATARYAFRHDRSALKKVAAVRKGTGYGDLAHDLEKIATLVDANRAAFEAVRFDFALCERARATGDELLKTHVACSVAMSRGVAKEIRDRAYTVTADAVAEIREAGVYVLRNEDRADWVAMFRSRHAVARGRRDRTRKAEKPPTP